MTLQMNWYDDKVFIAGPDGLKRIKDPAVEKILVEFFKAYKASAIEIKEVNHATT